jgi:hypothetical protein
VEKKHIIIVVNKVVIMVPRFVWQDSRGGSDCILMIRKGTSDCEVGPRIEKQTETVFAYNVEKIMLD